MNRPVHHPERTIEEAEAKLAWLIALVCIGLVIVAAALALDLHNQKRRLENLAARLKLVEATREAEGKTIGARSRTTESALNRLSALQAEGEADLKKLGEIQTQREPVVKQATEIQGKIQALANDLLELAKTDPDAKAIVHKYNVQQNTPPAGVGAAKP